jgi:PAS domain S-box-containing protein
VSITVEQELYRVLVQAAPDAVIAIDPGSQILLCNPATERIFGYDASAMLGRDLAMLIPERLRERHRAGLARYFATGNRTVDWRGVRAFGLRSSGEEFPIVISFAETELSGQQAFLGFIRDLGPELAAAAALSDAQRLHEALLVSVGEGIMGLSAEGLIRFANPAAVTILGMAPSALLDADFHEVTGHTDSRGLAHSREECPIIRAVADGQGLHLTDERFTLASNEVVAVDILVTPLRGETHGTGAVIAFRDIGDRLRLEDQLRQTQKMEAVGQLAGGIAHDFNNMLSVILAHADFLREEVLSPTLEEEVVAITAAAQRAAGLTKQLLAYSRKQLLVLKPLHVYSVVAGLEPMLRRAIGEHIVFVSHCTPCDDSVLGDQGQLEQVITNLVLNARDAMTHGGTLSVEVECIAAAPRDVNIKGPVVVLRVTDTGTGMDATTQRRAFEPFFTTKQVGEGTGLGLATVHGIVTQFGGVVQIESAPGAGTTVRVFLPHTMLGVHAATPASAMTAIPAEATGARTILVVEDEAAVRHACVRILQGAGYRVIEARHGADALLVAAQSTDEIALLLTDVVMPEVGGVELAAWFNRTHPGRPVVFMSGYTNDDLFQSDSGEFTLRLVTKPFTATSLLAGIAEALGAKAVGATVR